MQQTVQNIRLSDRRTSLRMEPAFWDALDEICVATGVTRNEFVQGVAKGNGTLSNAVRVAILEYFRNGR